jgi:hypothetical protein
VEIAGALDGSITRCECLEYFSGEACQHCDSTNTRTCSGHADSCHTDSGQTPTRTRLVSSSA